MGRLVKRYSPDPLVLRVRVRPVCSLVMVTSALGMTLPEASVTSPVMLPRVCWASAGARHSAAAAKRISSRRKENDWVRIEQIKRKPHKYKSSRGLDWYQGPSSGCTGQLRAAAGPEGKDESVRCSSSLGLGVPGRQILRGCLYHTPPLGHFHQKFTYEPCQRKGGYELLVDFYKQDLFRWIALVYGRRETWAETMRQPSGRRIQSWLWRP